MLENTGDADRELQDAVRSVFDDDELDDDEPCERCGACDALRDQFAAAALTGMLANETIARAMKSLMDETDSDPTVMCAEMSYEYADAMLEARKAKR